jgi:hypothetical protein
MERSDPRLSDSGRRIVVQRLSDGDPGPEEYGREREPDEPEYRPGTARPAACTALNVSDHRWR